ncbi:HVO_2901 family zinc finger protein [Halegenticoccus soli]|uniref:HVO_2901 family zinc finger protein n=1 Tax=Halegenticoccus soli TaxID=1985678 RepID=UPI000C6D9822
MSGVNLHRETGGRDMLVCRKCGSEFPEGRATRDGWYYRCPADGCDSEGLGEGLRRIRRRRSRTR